MLYQERYSSAYLSQAQSSLVQWGLDGKLRTILDTIKCLEAYVVTDALIEWIGSYFSLGSSAGAIRRQVRKMRFIVESKSGLKC